MIGLLTEGNSSLKSVCTNLSLREGEWWSDHTVHPTKSKDQNKISGESKSTNEASDSLKHLVNIFSLISKLESHRNNGIWLAWYYAVRSENIGGASIAHFNSSVMKELLELKGSPMSSWLESVLDTLIDVWLYRVGITAGLISKSERLLPLGHCSSRLNVSFFPDGIRSVSTVHVNLKCLRSSSCLPLMEVWLK